MRIALWIALAYLAVNYLMCPSIAKGAAVGLIFAFMVMSRKTRSNG